MITENDIDRVVYNKVTYSETWVNRLKRLIRRIWRFKWYYRL